MRSAALFAQSDAGVVDAPRHTDLISDRTDGRRIMAQRRCHGLLQTGPGVLLIEEVTE